MTAVTTTHPESETAKPIHRTAAALFAVLAVAAAFAMPATADAARFGDSSNLPVACDLADCNFTVDPSAEDQCFIPGGDSNQPGASFVVKGDKLLAVNLPWGKETGFEYPVWDNMKRVYIAAVSGNWEDIFSRCDRNLVASTGRALGVYAWLTRDELDQVAPFIAYPGLPADLVPAGDSLSGGGETVEPVGDATDNRPDAQAAATEPDGTRDLSAPPIDVGADLSIPGEDLTQTPVGCDYAAGECNVTVDPAVDECLYLGAAQDQIFVGKDNTWTAVKWPFGKDPELDSAIAERSAKYLDEVRARSYWPADLWRSCGFTVGELTSIRSDGGTIWFTPPPVGGDDQSSVDGPEQLDGPATLARAATSRSKATGVRAAVKAKGSAKARKAAKATKRKAAKAGKRAAASRSKKASTKSKRPAAKKRGR